MMKWHCGGPPGQTSQTHQAEGQNNYWNYPLFDFPKTIDPTEESPEGEDFLEEEDFPEEEDTLEEGEYHQEDHLEEVGGHRRCLYHKPTKGSW